MARIEKPTQILTDDFADDQKELIEKLAYIINPAFENFYNLSNNGTSFSNMSWGLIPSIVVKVRADGSINMTSGAQNVTDRFKNVAQYNPVGIQVISATCIDDPNTKVKGQPFIQYTILDNNIIQIQNIQGLPEDKRFSLTLMLITS